MSDQRRGDHGKRFGNLSDTAWRTVIGALIVVVLGVTVIGLGWLVVNERVTPEPFLLLVGIVVGFLLGRLDAVL